VSLFNDLHDLLLGIPRFAHVAVTNVAFTLCALMEAIDWIAMSQTRKAYSVLQPVCLLAAFAYVAVVCPTFCSEMRDLKPWV